MKLGANPTTCGAIVVAALTLLAGCGGGGSSSTPAVTKPTATPSTKATATPTATPAPQRLYVSPTFNEAAPISYYTYPFANSSVPTSSFTPTANNETSSLITDSAGNVIEGESQVGTITSYSRPAPATAAQFIMNDGFPSVGMAFGPTGTLYVANALGSIETASAPLSAATTFTPLITTGVGEPWNLAFDSAGNLYVTNYMAATFEVYAPPYDGTPIVVATQAGTKGSLGCAYDMITNQVIVTEGNSTSGDLVFYNLPLTNTPTPAAIVSYSAGIPLSAAIDRSGNLFVSVAAAQSESIQVLAPPFVSATNPTPLISIPAPLVGGNSEPIFSMAFGT